jgi:PLD-like domain
LGGLKGLGVWSEHDALCPLRWGKGLGAWGLLPLEGFSVDVAMYSFTDRELAAELVRLARSGVRVRVYRDSRESTQENQRGSSTTATLLAGGVEVRVKASQELMHFNYVGLKNMWCTHQPTPADDHKLVSYTT